MTEPTDIDALIAEARGVILSGGPTWETDAAGYIADLATALESTAAELRQERERADKYQDLARRTELQCQDAEAALSRAEETIEGALRAAPKLGELRWRKVDQMIDILAAYDQEKP